ncbi:hypothetical protein ACO0LG_01770 [Undibacterium sp. Ji42W]|uniref:hypothetical protein n=1 Tax=Undibacterium sp. Ji42W TaxID=3413039 RepID=UPI003BF1270D
MTITPTTIDLSERDRQPIIRIEAFFYPCELYATRDKLFNILTQIDGNNPANIDIYQGLCTLSYSLKHANSDMEAAARRVKAGA